MPYLIKKSKTKRTQKPVNMGSCRNVACYQNMPARFTMTYGVTSLVGSVGNKDVTVRMTIPVASEINRVVRANRRNKMVVTDIHGVHTFGKVTSITENHDADNNLTGISLVGKITLPTSATGAYHLSWELAASVNNVVGFVEIGEEYTFTGTDTQ